MATNILLRSKCSSSPPPRLVCFPTPMLRNVAMHVPSEPCTLTTTNTCSSVAMLFCADMWEEDANKEKVRGFANTPLRTRINCSSHDEVTCAKPDNVTQWRRVSCS